MCCVGWTHSYMNADAVMALTIRKVCPSGKMEDVHQWKEFENLTKLLLFFK